MISSSKRLIVAAASAAASILALASCNQTEQTANATANTTVPVATTDHKDPIASAMAAAPASIGAEATIVQSGADGKMTTLRPGTNGWTCMPDSPATPGPDPMCMDANAMKWAEAWMGHKPPPSDAVGLMYMLTGGTDASNTDPYAQKPTADNDWVKTGPHIMVVGSKELLVGHPSGAKPDTAVPYVMWAGTPYAHLMIPVG